METEVASDGVLIFLGSTEGASDGVLIFLGSRVSTIHRWHLPSIINPPSLAPSLPCRECQPSIADTYSPFGTFFSGRIFFSTGGRWDTTAQTSIYRSSYSFLGLSGWLRQEGSALVLPAAAPCRDRLRSAFR